MDSVDEVLTRGVDTIYPSKNALEKVLRSGKKIRLYQGFDPTGTQLHIGHLAGLIKLRQFQRLGHEVIFLIGDFTATIGDPSGKSGTRKPMTREEAKKNAMLYKSQVSHILDFEGKNPINLRYNSEWHDKTTYTEFIQQISYFSLQQIIKREMFQKRIEEGKDLYANELLYPVFQAYDSVAMDVDLEIGGSDQLFNMMTGRDLMHKMKKKDKYVMTLPLLSDKEGKKIGKTEGNVIALTSKPNELFGMIMNLPDEVIGKCFEMITDLPMEEVIKLQEELKNTSNPMPYKKKLAYALVRMLNSEKEAKEAENYFENTFQKKSTPDNIPEAAVVSGKYNILDLINSFGIFKSKSDIRRLISDGAIDIDDKNIKDINTKITVDKTMTVKLGKHKFIKIIPT